MSELTSADFDRIDQLTAMLAVLPKITAAGRTLLSIKQQTEAMDRAFASASLGASTAKEEAVAIRADIAKAREALKAAEAESMEACASMVADAEARAKSIVQNAEKASREVMQMAHDDADAAKHEAATIRATIANERAEVAKLEAKAAKIREQLKKMIGE